MSLRPCSGCVDELQRGLKRSNSSKLAKVEHPFRIPKRIFGFDKVCCRGLAKKLPPAMCLPRVGNSLRPPQTPGRVMSGIVSDRVIRTDQSRGAQLPLSRATVAVRAFDQPQCKLRGCESL
jgi:hypothetical protein